MECRRVVKKNGSLSFLIPTDPGILNQLVKKLYSYKKLKSKIKYPPNLIYALDHKNGIVNILAIINYVFRNDRIKIQYYPFFVHSINFNLALIVDVKII